MQISTPTFASLFSGCGGFDLGFIQKGFHPRGAFDSDSQAIANFKANVAPDAFLSDLTQGLPNRGSLREIDVVIAGPPCQGFSTAGRRLIDDKRNHLLPLTGRLAIGLHPKVVVIENVAGALSGAHSRYWAELDGTLRASGYKTKTIRVNAADLGMAQLRTRVLLFAWRTDRIASFTVPSKPTGNLREALANLTGTKNHRRRLLEEGTRDWQIARRILPGQKLSNVRGGDNAVATWDIPEVFGPITDEERTVLELLRRLRRQDRQRDHGDADPVSFGRLEKALGSTFLALVDGLVAKSYLKRVNGGIDLVGTFNGKFRRLTWSGASCTVDTRFGSPRYFLHPAHQRGFSVREAARIQGFPDDYHFFGDELDHYRLIGNAVPPPLARFAADMTLQLLA